MENALQEKPTEEQRPVSPGLSAAREALAELNADVGQEGSERQPEDGPSPSADLRQDAPRETEKNRDDAGRFKSKKKGQTPDVADAGNEAEQPADPLSDVPTHVPNEWRDLIKQNPAAKALVIKQFSEGNKIINRKTQELSDAQRKVDAYFKTLTTGLDHVVQERYRGDRNVFAADINRLVQSLNHPQAWKRYEALKEITALAFPEGYDIQQAPDANQRAIFEQLEELKQSRAAAQVQPPQQAPPPVKDAVALISVELENIGRYNADARDFIADQANANLIRDKYQQAMLANPQAAEANVAAAIFEAMKEKAKLQAAAAAKETQDAKRNAAVQLSVAGNRNSRAEAPPTIVRGYDAARAALAELKNIERV